MSQEQSQPTSGPDVSALERKVSDLGQTLARHQARLSRGNKLTGFLGGALCIVLLIYFVIGYWALDELLTPSVLVGSVEGLVLDALPEARSALEKEINESADDWAADLSGQLQDKLPDARAKLEDFVINQTRQGVRELQTISGQKFRSVIQANRPTLQEGFDSLQDPEKSKEFLADLQRILDGELGGDMQQQSEDLLHMVVHLNTMLLKLKAGEGLNSEEAVEREILMLARRLRDETALAAPETN